MGTTMRDHHRGTTFLSSRRMFSYNGGVLLLSCIILLLLPSLTPTVLVLGDSHYCSPFTSSSYVWPTGMDEYHSCCGISAAGSTKLKQTGGDILQAASVSEPYIACRSPSDTTVTRCCPLKSDEPLVTDTTGRSIVYTFQPVSSDSEYTCVAPFSAGGCCDVSECVGTLDSDQQWMCSSQGLCVIEPVCKERLSFNRIMVLFIPAGVIMLIELIVHLSGGRLYSIDTTCGQFGRQATLVQVLWFMVRESFFQFLVIANFAIAIAGHIWNAASPLDACVQAHDGKIAEIVWACLYAAVFILAFMCRTRPLDETDAYRNPYQDALLYMHFVHVAPFVWLFYQGPGQSWVDLILLGQQAIGFRWMWLAVVMWPCMNRCAPTSSSHQGDGYSNVFRFIDYVFWRSHIAFFERDGFSRREGYNRRRFGGGSGITQSPGQLFQITSHVPGLKSTQEQLEERQEFVGTDANPDQCAQGIIGPVRPVYAEADLNQMNLVSPHTGAGRQGGPPSNNRVAPTPWLGAYTGTGGFASSVGGAHSSPPPRRQFDFGQAVDEAPPARSARSSPGEPGIELGRLNAESVTATVDDEGRIVALHVAMPSGLTVPGIGSPAAKGYATPSRSRDRSPMPTDRSPHPQPMRFNIEHATPRREESPPASEHDDRDRPTTGSILRLYPDPPTESSVAPTPARKTPTKTPTRQPLFQDEDMPSARPLVHQHKLPPLQLKPPSPAPTSSGGGVGLNPWGPMSARSRARQQEEEEAKSKSDESQANKDAPLALGDLKDDPSPNKQSLRAKRRAAEREKEEAEAAAAAASKESSDPPPSTPPRRVASPVAVATPAAAAPTPSQQGDDDDRPLIASASGPSSSPQASPSPTAAVVTRGRVVDGTYIPPSSFAPTPKPQPTKIEIDEDLAQREFEAFDRGRAAAASAASASARKSARPSPSVGRSDKDPFRILNPEVDLGSTEFEYTMTATL